MKFVGQGRCEDVLTYPLHSASVYRFCSSVPGFVVSLPSVLASQQTTLRLTNWLLQLANERLSLSGIFKVSSIPLPMLGAHKMFASGGLKCSKTFLYLYSVRCRGQVVVSKSLPNANTSVGHHAFQTKKYLKKLIIFGGLIKRI